MKIVTSRLESSMFNHSRREFDATKFIFAKYGVGNTLVYDYNKYSKDVIELLEKEGEAVFETVTVNSLGVYTLDNKIFFYKDNIIEVDYDEMDYDEMDIDEAGNVHKVGNGNLKYHVPLGVKCISEDFSSFRIVPKPPEKVQAQMSLLLKTATGALHFYPFSADLVDVDLALNYGEKFLEIDEAIQEKLSQNKAGLYIFRGPPGTGKSTYIKYLTSQLEREVLFIPNNMGHLLSDPSLLTLLMDKRGALIVLEDAEKMIVDREENVESPVSSILNLTDGFISNVLNISIVLTFNCDKQGVDQALLRKGRLSFDYEFNKLEVADAQKLLDKKGLNFTATEPMSLADIFFVNDANSAKEVLK